jgi:hypothetical protein
MDAKFDYRLIAYQQRSYEQSTHDNSTDRLVGASIEKGRPGTALPAGPQARDALPGRPSVGEGQSLYQSPWWLAAMRHLP